MPPRTRARAAAASKGPVALTDADITLLKERLETGKRPRVMLLVDTALGAAGTSVPVVSFGDPADGEYISVRLRDDVVPFAPAELGMPKRGVRPAPADAALPASLPLDPPAEPAPAKPPAPPAAKPPASAADKPRLVAVPDAPAEPAPTPAAAPAPAAPAAPAKPAAGPPAKSAGSGSRRPRAGSFAVTLRFTGDAWTYETTRGGKRSAARPLNLAAVRGLADRVDDPALRRDLQEAVNLCRQQVQTRAQALRAELEQIEVELAELDE
jgi:hypothetical protein